MARCSQHQWSPAEFPLFLCLACSVGAQHTVTEVSALSVPSGRHCRKNGGIAAVGMQTCPRCTYTTDNPPTARCEVCGYRNTSCVLDPREEDPQLPQILSAITAADGRSSSGLTEALDALAILLPSRYDEKPGPTEEELTDILDVLVRFLAAMPVEVCAVRVSSGREHPAYSEPECGQLHPLLVQVTSLFGRACEQEASILLPDPVMHRLREWLRHEHPAVRRAALRGLSSEQCSDSLVVDNRRDAV